MQCIAPVAALLTQRYIWILLAILGDIATGYTLITGGRAEVQEPASGQ